METSVLGGGLLLAIAAALWLVYLVPNWLRRREYLATERNAVRLQQTIRVLAETAETPEAVRVESAARARALVRELGERPVAVGQAPRAPLSAHLDPRARATRRLRRTRLIVALAVAAGVVVGIVQAVLGITGGFAAVSVPVAVGAGILVVAGVAMLGRLAKVGRDRAAAGPPIAAAATARSVVVPELASEGAASDARASGSPSRQWTPVPVPRPRYLEQRPPGVDATPAQMARAAARAEAELSEAAELAARALRAAEEQAAAARTAPAPARPEPAPAAARTTQEPAAAAPASRYARMGVVDVDESPAMPDIEQALRRRRAG